MTVDLRTRYLGLDLGQSDRALGLPARPADRHAAPPPGRAGAAAVVLPSLFEEQIEHDEMQIHGAFETGVDSYAEALTYLPEFEDYNTGHRRLPASPRGDEARSCTSRSSRA